MTIKTQSQRKAWKDKLNGICAGIVKSRAKGVCECCKLQRGVAQHHLNKKDTNALWFYIPGIAWLCDYCHHWCEVNPTKNKEFAIKLRGEAVWSECVRLRRTTGTTLAEVEESLKEEI